MTETIPALKGGRILRRHLITGFALLVLPLLLLHQSGQKDLSMIVRWVLGTGLWWLVWFGALLLSSAIAYFMADRLIWPGWMQLLGIDLYEPGRFRDLFRKWALCWRCLGYWYGGAISFLLWAFFLPVWYGAFYFAMAGASFGAAITAFIVIANAKTDV